MESEHATGEVLHGVRTEGWTSFLRDFIKKMIIPRIMCCRRDDECTDATDMWMVGENIKIIGILV